MKAVKDQRVERRIFDEAELGKLALEADLGMRELVGKNVPKSNPVVKGADFKRQLAAGVVGEIDESCIVVVAHTAGFADGNGIGFVVLARFNLDQLQGGNKRRLPFDLQAQ